MPHMRLTNPPLPFAVQVSDVYTETDTYSGTRTVSWEGSGNVTSVMWCFGAPFPADSSLIQCKARTDFCI